MKMEIERTKSGIPCVWESGGGYTNTGVASIIAGKDGQPKKAIYVRKRGYLANGEHALIPISVGDYIIKADHHRGDFEVEIYKIVEVQKEKALIKQVNYFSTGEWDAELPAYLETAVDTAIEKATCYHCREPHYIK